MRRTSGKTGIGPGRATGFTLVEVMTALGLLAIALPMIAAAFISGMVENRESVENTMTTLLAENAIAVLRCGVTHADFDNTAAGQGTLTLTHRVPDSVIDEEDLLYQPFDVEDRLAGEDPEHRTKFACVILGQRMAADANDYRFAVLVYRKLKDDDTVGAARVKFNADETVDDDPAETYVRLSGASSSALIGYYIVRMSLRPGA